MILRKTVILTLIISVMLFQGCSSDDSTETMVSSSNEFVLTTTKNKQLVVKKDGAGFVVEGMKGRVILFDIFATWCPPCQKSASLLSSLQTKFNDDLLVVGITIEKDIPNSKLQEFGAKYDATYTMVNSSVNLKLVSEIADAIKLPKNFPIPLMVLYIDGKYVTHYLGKINEEFIQSDIKRALGE